MKPKHYFVGKSYTFDKRGWISKLARKWLGYDGDYAVYRVNVYRNQGGCYSTSHTQMCECYDKDIADKICALLMAADEKEKTR